MAGGPTITVRQVASYPAVAAANPADLVLLQQGGLGGPYAAIPAAGLVATALMAPGTPALGVGFQPPLAATASTFALAGVTPLGRGPYWNAYPTSGADSYWQSNIAGRFIFDQLGNFRAQLAPAGVAGAAVAAWLDQLVLSPAGAMSLPHGTLSVARDPNSALEVATMGWVGASTVASFNGRKGVVTLSCADLSAALGYDVSCIATMPWVEGAICAAIQDLIHTYPAVWSWNGRVGDVWLTVDDINWALAQPGAPPLIIPTPPADATNGEAVTAEWVINYVTNTAGLATEAWVNQQIAAAMAATVTSFNGRQGVVLLTLADVTNVGGAPLASPDFTGIPTAPTANSGTSSAQLATTAFVMNTLTALTPGVVSFNGRAGTVTLTATDINNAGGALLASPNFTGVPAAPTAPAGTSTSQLATTQFVMQEIAATTAGVVSFNGRSGIVTLNVNDIEAAGGAPAASPALTGIPTAPTAANGTSTQQLATTAFVMNEINAINAGVVTFNGRSGTVTLTQNDVTAVGGLVNPSAALTGTPTAPTPAPTDNSTNIATTAFVHAALANITGGAVVQNTPPPSPTTGMLWFNTGDAQTYVWNGTAWVIAVNPPLGNYMPISGGTFTGPITAPQLTVTGTTSLGATTVTTLTATTSVSTPALASTGTLNVTGTSTLGAVNATNLSTSASVNPQGGIVGVTNGSNAAAGMVGEFQSSSGSAGLGWGAYGAVCSITLGAGDWDVWGMAGWTNSSGSGTVTSVQASMSTSSTGWTGFLMGWSVVNPPGGPIVNALCAQRLTITTTTTVWIVIVFQGNGFVSVTGSGWIYARRVR